MEDAINYQELKNTSMKRYNFTEEVNREKFRKCKSEDEETMELSRKNLSGKVDTDGYNLI